MDESCMPVILRLKAIFEREDQDYDKGCSKIRNICNVMHKYEEDKTIDKITICGIINFIVNHLKIKEEYNDIFYFKVADNKCTIILKEYSNILISFTNFVYSTTISILYDDSVKTVYINPNNIKAAYNKFKHGLSLWNNKDDVTAVVYMNYAVRCMERIILSEFKKFKESGKKTLKDYYDKR